MNNSIISINKPEAKYSLDYSNGTYFVINCNCDSNRFNYSIKDEDLINQLNNHRESNLVIICDNCNNEFKFSLESYLALKKGIVMEYSKKVLEKKEALHIN